MKTIEEAAKEFAGIKLNTVMDAEELYFNSGAQDYVSFRKGVEFAQTWIPVEQELPLCYMSGDWDGLKSDFVLIKDKYNNWSKGILYSGTIDGNNFNDWYSVESVEIPIVTHWRPIELE